MIWMQQMYLQAIDALRSLRDREEGQGMVEYALILFLVSVVAILVLEAIGTNVTAVFEDIRDALV